MHRYFCTYFDYNYLVYAKILSQSLTVYQPKHTLYIVCMDTKAFEVLEENPIPNTVVFAHQELTQFRPALNKIKSERSPAEYFFTCSAQVCAFILNKNPHIDILNYVDADLCFYSSPEPLFKELDKASIGIIPHGFHWTNRSKIKYGKFNVGWISFRNDLQGTQCITDWANDCLDWCFQKLEKGRYADQKYLDYWPEKYDNLKILKHKGANVAIWNIKKYKLQTKGNQIFIDELPLIFYHFAGLKQLRPFLFHTHLGSYFVRLKGILKQNIYTPYIIQILMYQSEDMVIFIKERNQSKAVNLARKFLNNLRTILYKDIIEITTT